MSEKEKKETSEIDDKAKALGAVFVIKIEDGEKTLSLYLKKPHRDIVGLYYGMKSQNPIKAAETLLKASFLRELSDEKILTDDDCFYSAYMQVDDYLDVIKLKKNHSMNL